MPYFHPGPKDAFFGQVNIGFINGNSPAIPWHLQSISPLQTEFGTARPGIRTRNLGTYLPNEGYFRMSSMLLFFLTKQNEIMIHVIAQE